MKKQILTNEELEERDRQAALDACFNSRIHIDLRTMRNQASYWGATLNPTLYSNKDDRLPNISHRGK